MPMICSPREAASATTTTTPSAATAGKLDVVTFIGDSSATHPYCHSQQQQQKQTNCKNCWFMPRSKCTTPEESTPVEAPLSSPVKAELHKAQARRGHFTHDVINNHRCKIAITELLSPYCQAMFRSTCTTVGHVIQSVVSLEKMSIYCTGAGGDHLSASLPSSEGTAAPQLSDGDFDDRVNANLDSELHNNNPLSDEKNDEYKSHKNRAAEQSSVMIYPSEGANSLDGDLFRFTPVSLTSAHTSDLAITINIALLAARGSKCCTLSETGGVVIADGFCRGLRCKSVSFEGTHNVVAIGNGMLRACSAERISFGPMPRLQIVGNDWMNGCTEMRKVEFACDFVALKSVGGNWLRCCRKVKSIDLECFPCLESVGSGWMERCHAISTITVNKLPHSEISGYHGAKC